ncbi:IS3 family transposase, partial [Dubosiella newyorkensis]
YNDSHQIYGSPKIAVILHKHGIQGCQKYVYSIMKEANIKPKYLKHKIKTTISKGNDRKLHNLLKRQFNPKDLERVWCTDITYIWTEEGFDYLTSVMDLYSRKIVGWVMTRNMEAAKVLECIEIAKRRRGIKKPLVIHSDQGVQYTSEEYKNKTEGMERSYSRKGNPWDNACIESFHSLIKREWINFYHFETMKEAKKAVFEYIEGFYNTIRIINGAYIKEGNTIKYRLPYHILVGTQMLEYDRSFLGARLFMNQFNGNLIVSGAFGLFQKKAIVQVGSYARDSLGEDMELVMKLHAYFRQNQLPYTIEYVPQAVCWTQVPTSVKNIFTQRRRWHVGLIQCLNKYRRMLFRCALVRLAGSRTLIICFMNTWPRSLK